MFFHLIKVIIIHILIYNQIKNIIIVSGFSVNLYYIGECILMGVTYLFFWARSLVLKMLQRLLRLGSWVFFLVEIQVTSLDLYWFFLLDILVFIIDWFLVKLILAILDVFQRSLIDLLSRIIVHWLRGLLLLQSLALLNIFNLFPLPLWDLKLLLILVRLYR